jgi:hypothetical protein
MRKKMLLALGLLAATAALSAQNPGGLTPLKPSSPADAAGVPAVDNEGYIPLDFFDVSNYDYNPDEAFEPTPKPKTGTVPGWIRALNGRKVKLYGMIMPLDFDNGGSTEFIVNATVDACGFGGVPRINEWAHVKLSGRRLRFDAGQEVIVRGTFRVGEQIENGRVVGLYSMAAETIW